MRILRPTKRGQSSNSILLVAGNSCGSHPSRSGVLWAKMGPGVVGFGWLLFNCDTKGTSPQLGEVVSSDRDGKSFQLPLLLNVACRF